MLVQGDARAALDKGGKFLAPRGRRDQVVGGQREESGKGADAKGRPVGGRRGVFHEEWERFACGESKNLVSGLLPINTRLEGHCCGAFFLRQAHRSVETRAGCG